MWAIPLTIGGSVLVTLLARMGGAARAGRQPSPVPVPRPAPLPPVEVPDDEPSAPSSPTNEDHGPVEEPEEPPPPAPTPPHDDAPDLPTPPPPAPINQPPAPVHDVPHEPPHDEPAHDEPAPSPTNEDEGPEEEPVQPPPPAPTPPHDDSHELPTPPTPTPEPLPGPAPTPVDVGPPAGFNWPHAAELAAAVANDLGEHGIDHYSHARLKMWQSLAGLKADGIYGGATRGALVWYLDNRVVKPFFKPTTTQPYVWASLVPQGAGLKKHLPAPTPTPTPTPVQHDDDTHEDEPAGPPAPAPTPPHDDGDAEVGPTPPPGFDPGKARRMAKQVAANIDSKEGNYSHELLKQFQLAAGIDVDGLYGGQSVGALKYYGVKRPHRALFKPVAVEPYKWAEQAGGAAP